MNPTAPSQPELTSGLLPRGLLLLGGLLLISTDAWAMRCGTRVITKGDIQAKVLKYCGEPVQTLQRQGYRLGILPDRRVLTTVSVDPENSSRRSTETRIEHYPYFGHTEVVIEEWIYNLGSRKLMRKITFENGIVADVETLGYGFRE